ncbi:hypothetical protein B7Z00_04200 [Candidatus Saccharibacteria bacterium 32-50-10]|nr:MAG: hypothetical protein B7Z00_04200 [Candidatus Saccharibacteria bacterium 32-50-10]
MPNRPELKFPKSFLWGVSTAAHQVEGGNHNQWSEWELENAKALAIRSTYQFEDLDNWPAVKHVAKQPGNYVSGRTVNHYTQYEQDFDLARTMHMNAFRFSVEWSRIQPEEDAWNAEAVRHYKDYIVAMKKRGLEPVMTLFHFTLPIWFARKGGFERRANIRYFVEFVDRILEELGPSVRYIITINEPETYTYQSYVTGEWPPQRHKKLLALRVYRNLALAHNRAAGVIHKKSRKYKVSVAKNSMFVYPGDDAWLSRASASVGQFIQDDYFLRQVYKTCDFLGVNYYMDARIYGYRMHNPQDKVSDLGWDMEPQNIELVLKRLHDKYHLPIMITENGVADATDQYRQWWLTQTIMALQKAMESGVDMLGYLHWSLLDNFEWDKGTWPRFGLFAVDYTTGARTPRPSALWLARVLKKIRG